jgi:hypothetical protein
MHEIVDFYTTTLSTGFQGETRVLEEIAFLEARLAQLGSGDCAYEKSMVRTYAALLQARRQQLERFKAERGRPAA